MSNIWAGDFGNEYTRRNDKDYSPRKKWWDLVCKKYNFSNVLEVGCNTGMNLRDIVPHLDHPSCAWGVDVNESAIERAKGKDPKTNFVTSSGLNLPFRDGFFDMVFTAGVLIHQSPETVEMMMQEVIRVSDWYVMAIEYDGDVFTEIPYRGMPGALFKGPFGDVYEKRYGLRLIEKDRVGKEYGFDDCTAWVFSKR